VDWFPVLLSLRIAACATLLSLLAGVPLAWLLSRSRVPGKPLLSSLTALPLVLPPTVLGYYLLVLIGRQGFLGRFLFERFGINLVFTWQAAVIAAAVVALPLMVRSVQAAMDAVDPELEEVARTLGKRETAVFFRITLPLAWQGVLAGTVLSFARAMGEFGATLMVAGNIPGKTQTLSIAIYDAVQSGNSSLANGLVILISVLTLTVLVVLNKLTGLKRW
jgi:molybdate transport system permease protein